MLLIVCLLVLVPIVELYVIVQVAGSIGALETFLLLTAMTVGGIWLVKREGLGVARRVQDQVTRGDLPAAEVVDGLLILAAGVLLLAPGFVTDVFGLLLLIPFTRRPVRAYVLRRIQSRLRVSAVAGPGFGPRAPRYPVTDVRSYERAEPRPTGPRPELGPGPDARTS